MDLIVYQIKWNEIDSIYPTHITEYSYHKTIELAKKYLAYRQGDRKVWQGENPKPVNVSQKLYDLVMKEEKVVLDSDDKLNEEVLND